jgi:hypothetical protein
MAQPFHQGPACTYVLLAPLLALCVWVIIHGVPVVNEHPDKRVIAIYNPRVGEENFDARKEICAWGSSESAFDRLAGVDEN